MITGPEKITDAKWREYLDRCTNASIYHTPEWMHFLVKTFGYKPEYRFSMNENGEIDGMLPLMQIKSRLTGNRIESLPFSHICEPLGNSSELIMDAVATYSEKENKYFQINAQVMNSKFVQENKFCTHILKMNKTKEEIWKGMDRGSTRWAVNRAKKEGVFAEKSVETEDIKAFYELNCLTKKDLGVPCHPYFFFENMMKMLKDIANLYISRINDEVIGAGIMLKYNKTILYGYGAANPEMIKLHPYNAFVWQCIEENIGVGVDVFDFGRTSHENTGLIQFKQKWGAERKELVYSYYPKNPESLSSNRDGYMYKIANKVIQKTPLGLYKPVSDKVFRHFG